MHNSPHLHSRVQALPACSITPCILHVQGTIRDNIAYGVEAATDEQVMAAAEAANAMLFIKKAPSGFRTQVRTLPAVKLQHEPCAIIAPLCIPQCARQRPHICRQGSERFRCHALL